MFENYKFKSRELFYINIKNMERNRSIKNRLFQTLANRSPKHTFLLQQDNNASSVILKPKHSHEGLTPSNTKSTPMFKSGKILLNPLPSQEPLKKKPREVAQQKLSREAKSIIEEGRSKLRTNLKPHDIFQLYDSFPEMLEDFFYLNRVSHPYDYQIVTYAQRNPMQYMTISSQGITLYHDKQAQFLTKQQWLRDEKRYYMLQKIYFFKQYKLSKNFRIWKNKMRRHYMRQMSGILNEQLFFAIKYPRSSLLEVKKVTENLKESANFFPYQNMEKLSQSQFETILSQYRQRVLLKNIKNVTHQITTSLQSAVAEEINKFKIQNNIKIDGVNQKQNTSKEGYIYSQEAILRKQYKRVYKLIKLADSILQQAKIRMVIECLEGFIDRISKLYTEDKQQWITCIARVGEDGKISWQPNGVALSDLFMKTIKAHIEALSEHNEKIVNNQMFRKYKIAECGESKSEQSRHNFKAMIEDSPTYSSLLHEIEALIFRQFKQTEKQEQYLQKFIDIYLRHKQIGNMSIIFKDNNAVQLCNYVQQWKKDEKTMQELSQEKRGKLILYNFSDLRKKIVCIPRQTLNSFLSLLPEQTLSRCKQLIAESRSLFDMISIYPSDIFGFAKFNKAVKQASQRLDDIRSAGSQICLLIDLMVKNKMSNIELYNSKKVEALNSINVLKNKVDQSQAKENESLSKFKKDNETQVAKMKTSIKDLSAKFNLIEFNQTKVTAKQMKQILGKIKQIIPSINQLESQSQKIQQIQLELNLVQSDFNEVHQLYENAKIVNQIWVCRNDWKTMLVNLYHKHYCEVDCTELKRSWDEFSNKINGMIKILPENDILKNLIQQLGEVQVLIDTIIALRSPNLQEKAWKQISQYLAYQLGIDNEADFPFSNNKNPLYTVKWLLQINIPVYKEKIQFIVRKSQKQRQLGQHLVQFKSFITNMTFDLVPKKRQVYVFGENTQIKQKLHSYLMQLYFMLDNHYSQSIKNQAENLIRHYEYTQQVLNSVLQFGEIWNKYESFFDGNSNSLKMLTKQSKQFFSWQTQWKKIIKNITTDPILFYKKVCDETTGINCSRSMMKQISKINITIDQVKKGLDEYLQKKRANFQRYFFIPDEQLLMMLSTIDSKEPICQSFVPILYKNIQKILYKEDTKDTLLGIISKQGEHFPLRNMNFKLQSQMQDIFKLTEEQIKKRLGYLIKNVFLKYIQEQTSRQAMIMDNNAQVVMAIDSISWVKLAEQTYLCNEPIGDLYDWIEIQQAQIKQLKNLLENAKDEHILYKLMQLMSQSIYQRQKTEFLLQKNVTNIDCYDWQKIPKLCMNYNNFQVYLKQLNIKLNYCYEFLGNKSISFITPQTEKSWIALSQAISNKEVVCLDKCKTDHIETIKQLGYMIAQEVEVAHVSQNINFKFIERYINGAIFTGNWVYMNQPENVQVLSFLAHQINHIRKSILDPNLQKSKAYFINSNVAFFLSSFSSKVCPIDALTPSLAHRMITLFKPSYDKVFGIMADCLCGQPQIGAKCTKICSIMSETFQNSYAIDFTKQFYLSVLNKVISVRHNYEWLKTSKCKQFYEFIICDILDDILLPSLKKDDLRVYEQIKSCIVPDYQKLRIRHPHHKGQLGQSISKFFEQNHYQFLKKNDYLEQFELLQRAISSNSLGVIIYGQQQNGKSTLVDLFSRKMSSACGKKIKINRIYHNAYNKQEIFKCDKGQTILSQILNDENNINWIIFDGSLSPQYLEIFGYNASKYLVPQIGILPSSRKIKFICETLDVTSLTPSVIGNHSLVYMADVLSADSIIRKMFADLQSRKLLTNLLPETVEWLIAGFITILNKLQNKSLLKSKQINFVYPLSIWEITQRCCRIIDAIFIMNWQSIREKEKIMRKLVDKFIIWSVYWSLIGLVNVEDEQKLQKLLNELFRTQSSYPDEMSSSIIYPGCGFQVQPINGLRTQSSLQIPERGILTNLLRSDLIPEGDHQKGNKFFQQIVISQPQVIRVNYSESNRFNYISQISFITNTPVFLFGAPNTGKKSIIELFAKNTRSKSQYYSLRYKSRDQLGSQIEKPFRKLATLEGIVLKSVTASKKLLISIDDLHLNKENKQTTELLRMIFNEKGYFNKQSEWIKFRNCSFNMLASKVTLNSDNIRLLSKTTLFQTSNNMIDKLHSIYSPYLKSWCAFNGLSGDVERIFNSQNGDTLLDATLSIYKLMEEQYKLDNNEDCLQKLLIKPRIGDIAKVLTYICRTPEANHYNLTYYYELWTHEVVRVFGDRLSSSKLQEILFKEIKKEALVKFKQNFTLTQKTMFHFTSLGIQNENCYIRIEDPSFLHTYISNLLEADQINLPLKFLFDQLLEYLIKIYRVITIEGAHMLLLSQNEATTKYLIELACQVGQNDCFDLSGEAIAVQKHIQPALFYKDNVCLSENIDKISTEAIYQIACLMNNNVLDFNMKPDVKEKIRINLNKKQKVQIQKKESKLFSTKSKIEQLKIQQKQEDIESLMTQQFMNYAHFVFRANPTSNFVKEFLLKKHDIVGKLHFCWIDIPEESIVKVTKQILNFDHESSEVTVQHSNYDRLIEKVKKIYDSNAKQAKYFNDFMAISEMVKTQSQRLITPLLQKLKQTKQSKDIFLKVCNQVKEKQQKIKCLQEQIDQTNAQLDSKCRDLEDINNKITQWQMNTNTEEVSNAQALSELRVQRQEIEIQLKLVKEKKQQLQPEKKKALKSIKIANDYLEIFNNSSATFDIRCDQIQQKIDSIQQKVILVWSMACYLSKTPVKRWIEKINNWITLINSKVPNIISIQNILQLIDEICVIKVPQMQLFSPTLRIKMQILFMVLHNYQQTTHYGKILKIHDQKGILEAVLEQMNTQQNNNFQLLKTYHSIARETKGQLQNLCRSKNGLIIIESGNDIEQVQLSFTDKKMCSYLNKILVKSTQQLSFLSIECDEQQLSLSIENMILKEVNSGLYQQRIFSSRALNKEKRKIQQNDDLFYKTSAYINIDSETYTQQLNKYKNATLISQQSALSLQCQLSSKKYLQFAEFQMIKYIYSAITPFWKNKNVDFRHLSYAFHQNIYYRNDSRFQEASIEQKGKMLQKCVEVNLGNNEQPMDLHFKYGRKWENASKLYVMRPSKTVLQYLQTVKQFKCINLLGVSNLSTQINQSKEIPKVLYNYIPALHHSFINELADILNTDSTQNSEHFILMAYQKDLTDIPSEKLKLVFLQADNIEDKKIDSQYKTKLFENIQAYEKNHSTEDHTAQLLSLLEKSIDLAKTQDQLLQLISDLIPQLPQSAISSLLNQNITDLTPYFYDQSDSIKIEERKSTEFNKAFSQMTNIKQELPFIFNTTQFIPSKDILAPQFIAQCILFNKKLKEIKQKLKDAQYEWQQVERVIPSTKQILQLNNSYQFLRRNLVKLHLIASGGLQNNKSASHKALSSNNIIFQNTLKLPASMLSMKLINLIKCKAAKKLKMRYSQIQVVWKITSLTFCYEELGALPELSFIVSGKLNNAEMLQKYWNGATEYAKKIELVACPIEKSELKMNPQCIHIPIMKQHLIVGYFQVNKSQIDANYMIGLETPIISIEQLQL